MIWAWIASAPLKVVRVEVKLDIRISGATTLTVTVPEVQPLALAVNVTGPPTAMPSAPKDAWVWPAGTVTEAVGTAMPVFELVRFTTRPPDGAGFESVR